MTRIRLIATVGLCCLLGALVGCGSKPVPTPTAGQDPQRVPAPGPTPAAPAPDASGAAYELDPAKHVVPTTPAAGQLDGKAFKPDRVEMEGNKLSFRQGKDFFADLSVDVFLYGKVIPPEALKVVVRPSQTWTDDIPSLHVASRKGDNLPETKFVNDGYALTLELEKAEKGKRAGKVYLCLPGAEKSYLAGTFVAERKRSLSEPPGDEEVPFIQGAVSPPLKKGQSVIVGYVGQADGKAVSDLAGAMPFGDDGGGGGSRSMSFAPRAAGVRFEKFVPHFDFTNLPPGRYLVFARVKDGPTAWAWTTVTAGQRVTADLKLDEKNVGTVEVKVPAGSEAAVRLVPADLGSPPPDEQFVGQLTFSLDLRGDVKDGKATIANVPAGKYQVRAGNLRGEVEVTAGKTATVELKPTKK